MKKLIKSISVICLALIMIFPLMLVGCDKNYKVDVEIVAGNGDVLYKDRDGISVVGTNTVDKGEKFEFYVTPDNGYKIAKVFIDGEEQFGYNKDKAYFYFEDVDKDHTVSVTFVTAGWTVEFYYLSEISGQHELYKEENVFNGGYLDLNQNAYGGDSVKWYTVSMSGGVSVKTYIYNNSSNPTDPIPTDDVTFESNIFVVRENKKLYCDKTKAELDAIFGVSE